VHLASLRRLAAPTGASGAALARLDTGAQYKKSITDLAPVGSGYIDLVCRVLHVQWPDAASIPAGAPHADFAPVVWVWDGTDAKPLPPGAPAAANEAGLALKERPLPLAEAAAGLPAPAEAPPAALAPLLRSAKDGLGGVPPLGTALPLVITPSGAATFTPADLPPAGTWIKLRNVGVTACGTQLQALYSAQSKWTHVMAVPEDLVLDAAKRLKAGMLARWAPGGGGAPALTASVTRVPPHIAAMPLSTLREARGTRLARASRSWLTRLRCAHALRCSLARRRSSSAAWCASSRTRPPRWRTLRCRAPPPTPPPPRWPRRCGSRCRRSRRRRRTTSSRCASRWRMPRRCCRRRF
jgi:hypothetical protein